MITCSNRAQILLVSLALFLAISLPARAQLTPQQDPANLAGERVSAPDLADNLPINHGAPALEQLLRKLRTRASFMLIVAHPDDEDNGMLTYLSRGQGARVATLTLNRGEGGQNLMSADFGDALGLLRTQELLACDRYMDVDQFFGTEVDFGFTKTKEEAFAKWTHDRVLYDAVRAVRLYRPLVIGSVFIGAPSDGHGQHQVAGEIAQEVFKAAGDPNVFPDQVAAGLQPWQPLKVYARSPFARIDSQGMWDYATSQYVPPHFVNYVTGKVTDTVPKANVVVPEGDTDPLLGGKSYAQFGREGRAQQRSQIGGGGGGFGGGPGGRADVSYHRYGSRVLGSDGRPQPDDGDSTTESSFFEGIDTTLPGIATLAPDAPAKLRAVLQLIDMKIEEAQKQFDPTHPEAIAEPLRLALQTLDTVISGTEGSTLPPTEKFNLLHELHIKRVQLNNALVLAHGLTLTATLADQPPSQPFLTTEYHFAVESKLTNGGAQPIGFEDVHLQFHYSHSKGGSPIFSAPAHLTVAPASSRTDRIVSQTTGLDATQPYFSRPGIQQPFYDVTDPALRNAPTTPSPLTALLALEDHGVHLEMAATVGDVASPHQPLAVVPPISVSLNRSNSILRPGEKSVETVARIDADDAIQKLGGVKVYLQRNSNIKRELLETALPEESSKVIGKPEYVGISVDASKIDGTTSTVTASVSLDNHAYSEGYRSVGYPGLTPTNYYTPATLRIVPIDVHTAPNLNIAYIPGTGDDVPSALEDLGIHPHILTATGLTVEALKPYDAVILGVRAYTAHSDLAGPGSQPLLDYARNGGVVIAQFMNGRYGPSEAPYPITVASSSGDHAHDVIDESSPVTILAPGAPALTWPNRITTADFDHWVDERGHSFAYTWSSEYQPLLSTHDPNQEPQQGGLLVAHTGKGYYVYLGLALYRQFPEGVPGAYRLLANLISLAKNPQ